MDGWLDLKQKMQCALLLLQLQRVIVGKCSPDRNGRLGQASHTDECVHVTVDDAHFCIIKYTLRNKYTQMTLIEQGAAQPVVDDDKIHTPPHMNMIFTEARQESARKPETGPLLLFPLAAYII